jgi:hypothetical protein
MDDSLRTRGSSIEGRKGVPVNGLVSILVRVVVVVVVGWVGWVGGGGGYFKPNTTYSDYICMRTDIHLLQPVQELFAGSFSAFT